MPKVPIDGIQFVGSGDVTIWLEEANGTHSPVIVPVWPLDFPNHLAVYLTESGKLGLALSRQDMIATCLELQEQENVLWFCNIPLDDFLAATDMDPQFSKKEANNGQQG